MADFARMTRMVWVSIPGRSSYWREIMRGAVDRLRSIPPASLDGRPPAARAPGRQALVRIAEPGHLCSLITGGIGEV